MTSRALLDHALYGGARALLGLLGVLPRPLALRLCRGIGRAWSALGGPRTDVADTNLAIAFPDKSRAERRRMRSDAFSGLAQGLAEVALLTGLDEAAARELVAFEGFEHIERARSASEGGGVILLTAHFGSFELFAAACSLRGIPVSIVHREQRNPALERLVARWREATGVEVLHRGSAARAVLRALRAGRVVAMPLDQDTPRDEGVFVPFFGRPACTRHAPARLAMRTGAPVVPGFLFRRPDGRGHVARLGPAIELVPAGDDPDAAVIENVGRMTAAIEEAVRAAPDHWIWVHRRWKTSPERGVNVYKPANTG